MLFRSKAVFLAHEQEKLQLSKELHDSLGPLLSLAKMNISNLPLEKNSEAVKRSEDVKKLLSDSIAEVRSISNSLMPSLLSKQGLRSALTDFAEQVNNAGEVELIFSMESNSAFDSETEINIYRIVQETVNNALKHSKASTVDLIVRETSSAISVEIKDNGIGFNIADLKNKKGNGMNNIYSRADLMKATIEIRSANGSGTQIHLLIPKKHEQT